MAQGEELMFPNADGDDQGSTPVREAEIPAAECRLCHGNSKVIDTASTPGPIRRRRECLSCGHRWTTKEHQE